jgi:uncharacterized membrane protein YqjE
MSETGTGAEPGGASAGGPEAVTRPRRGVRDTIGALAALAVAAIHTRIELAALEFTEERERARARLVLLLVAAVAGGFALLALNVMVMLVLWEHWRMPGLAALLAFYVLVAALAAWRLSVMGQRERRPFDATLTELDRDRAWLSSRLGGRS